MTEPVRLSIIDPDDSCQSVLCSRIDGRCVGSHCGRCGAPSSHQGHYTSICRHKPIPQPDRASEERAIPEPTEGQNP